MRRLVFAALYAGMLVSLAILSVPAQAGDYYYDGGYRHHHGGNVWYSSSCCYRKIVRHERSVRYSRIDEGRPYYRNGYYERPYRQSYYDDPPRRYVRYDDGYVSRRYVGDDYYIRGGHRYGHGGYYRSGGYYNGYGRYYRTGGYDAGYQSYAQSCYRRSVRILDGRGGWVWGSRRVCY